ncbi:Ig-like domain-containing protein [Rhodoferax sp.]|uniref:Ig-like domain-containing protein n=1 Tax=Rhodoferax sp. TaxID=50421 RepID=UPI0025F7A398|nr:Ig-like domain-containing protein [Rhodoferax sp.]MCM2295373.1 Ig-like domain-containing protein [Rhodoferax sp.]
MNFIKGVAALGLSLALAACGGGGGSAGTPVTDTTASPPASTASSPTQVATEMPATVEVLASSNSLLSAGSEALITTFVKNSGNVGLPGQSVSFAASSGTLQVISAVTDSAGSASAKLIAGGDKSIRDIAVTVTAGSVSGSVVLPVTGTLVTLAGSGSLQAGGAASQYTVRAVDSSGNAIAGATIAVSSTLGNSLSSSSLRTDSTGVAKFLYTPNIAGTDTLIVAGLGTSASSTIVINAIDFVALSPSSNTLIPIDAQQIITVQYKISGVGVPGQSVAFSTTRGEFVSSTATTDANGEATAILSSSTSGPAVVVAQISGIGSVNLPVQFVAITPARIVVQANPGSVLPNSFGASNQSTIEALVRDANGNAVANRQVNFTLVKDLSNGTLLPGIATTDANGRAQVQFIPGASSTPSDGVEIKALVANTTISGTTLLTVNGKALFITIAFGNTITNLDETVYKKPFSIYVTDANGVSVGNQIVSLSVIPTEYYKGFMSFVCGAGDVSSNCVKRWRYGIVPTSCPNEDLNLDGFLDVGEDTNNNGQLTPGNVVVTAPSTVTTDATGRASFDLEYGEQFAPWVTVAVTARASVAGTESRQTIVFDLVGLDSDFTSETPPAGATSPFGLSGQCTDPN